MISSCLLEHTDRTPGAGAVQDVAAERGSRRAPDGGHRRLSGDGWLCQHI